MGSVCCCFRVPDVEENADSNGWHNGNCICTNHFIHNLMNKYGALFGNGGTNAVPSSDQETVSSNYELVLNNSSDTNMARGAPLPNNASPGYTQLQQSFVITRHEKGSCHSRVEPEPLGESDVQVIPKLSSGGDEPVGSNREGESKACGSESSVNVLFAKVENIFGCVYSSSEDEDVCPTCLEGYNRENPKIMTQCSHHYHLSCILEWKERSETCPVCGKKMEFDETT